MSQLKVIREQIAESKQLIQSHTGISDADYSAHYFETAVALAEKMCKDPQAASVLTNDAIYWGWFAMQWMDSCNEFLESITYQNGEFALAIFSRGFVGHVTAKQDIARTYYKFLTNKMLHCEHNSNIMHLSFHAMIKRKSVTV